MRFLIFFIVHKAYFKSRIEEAGNLIGVKNVTEVKIRILAELMRKYIAIGRFFQHKCATCDIL